MIRALLGLAFSFAAASAIALRVMGMPDVLERFSRLGASKRNSERLEFVIHG